MSEVPQASISNVIHVGIKHKPRHDFVYISADLSRPCRIAVSLWI